MSNPTADIVFNPGNGHIVDASASAVVGNMSGSNTAQFATQAYVDANGPSGAFPSLVAPIQLGTPSAPIAPAATYTYDIDLGGQYVEIALTNFGWVERNSTIQTDPGTTLSRAVFTGTSNGGVLIVNVNHLGIGNGLSWYRGFRMAHNEYQDGVSSAPVVQIFFADANDVSGPYSAMNPLGYGLGALETPLDNLELETVPPAKLEISDAWLSAPGAGNTHLYITVKNCGSTTLTLAAYFGVEKVYNYQFPDSSGSEQFVTITSDDHMAVTTSSLNGLSVSEDGGQTWINASTNVPAMQGFGLASYVSGGVDHIAFIGRDLLSGNVDVATCSSANGYAMSQVNTFTLPAPLEGLNINNSPLLSLSEIGGHQLSWNSNIGAFLYVPAGAVWDVANYTQRYLSNDVNLYTSTDGFAHIGSSIFSASTAIPGWVSSGWFAPMYLKAIDANHMFISLGYNNQSPSTYSNSEITVGGGASTFANSNRFNMYAISSGFTVTQYDFWFYEAAVAASLLLQKLTYTAVTPGFAGNSINITYAEDGVAGAETVDVAGNGITVHIGNHSVLSSTSNQVKTAIQNSSPATALVSVSGGDNVADQLATSGGIPLVHGEDAWTYGGSLPGGQNFPVTLTPGMTAAQVTTALLGVLNTNLPHMTITQLDPTHINLVSTTSFPFQIAGSLSNLPITSYMTYGATGDFATNYALLKTSNGGSSWSQILTQPEFVYASNRVVQVSDDGNTILVVIVGMGGYQTYPYSSQEYHFNMSTNGGTSWQYSTGAWPLIAASAPSNYSLVTPDLSSASMLLCQSAAGDIIFLGRKSSADNNYDPEGLPAISRSSGSGSSWSAFSELSDWSTIGSMPGQICQNEAIDSMLAFIDAAPGNAGADSYLYKGSELTTFTNWPVFAR